MTGNLVTTGITGALPSLTLDTAQGGENAISFRGHNGVDWFELARFEMPSGIAKLWFDDDVYLRPGKDSDGTLPTASEDYRGCMVRVEGGSGAADKLYICMKKSTGVYAWIQVATG